MPKIRKSYLSYKLVIRKFFKKKVSDFDTSIEMKVFSPFGPIPKKEFAFPMIGHRFGPLNFSPNSKSRLSTSSWSKMKMKRINKAT